jgi:hypothetical protein
MADNNYKNSNSLGDNYVLTNPYTCPSNAVQLSIDKVDCCQYYASFSYVVAAGGATVTVTPLTGNTSADLNYYRVSVSDGSKTVANSLDLASPAAAFVINTSTLDPSAAWTLTFAGSEGGDIGDAGCGLCYDLKLGVVGVAGASGDSIPAEWVNVSFLLKLTSTDDPNFNLFPADGLEIANAETVDLTQFLDGGATQLTNAASLIFTLEIKKRELQPSVSASPTVDAANAVFASYLDTVSYPYAVEKNFEEMLNTVTIATAVAGQFSETMTVLLTNEGVTPSVSFTLTTDVAV